MWGIFFLDILKWRDKWQIIFSAFAGGIFFKHFSSYIYISNSKQEKNIKEEILC